MVRVLARHAVRLHSDPASELCSADDVVVDLTNDDTTANEEGLIGCSLSRTPTYSSSPPWRVSKADFGGKVELDLANLECTIYPRGQRGRRQARNLEAAVGDLEAMLHRSA